MTEDEARSILGVDRESSKDAVRRAYLALTKKHKPDRDPEGFRRVREAFERLDRGADARPVAFDVALESAPRVERTPSPPAAQEPLSAPDLVDAAVDADPMADYWSRFDAALDGGAPRQ